jgi:hypothetical protein
MCSFYDGLKRTFSIIRIMEDAYEVGSLMYELKGKDQC